MNIELTLKPDEARLLLKMVIRAVPDRSCDDQTFAMRQKIMDDLSKSIEAEEHLQRVADDCARWGSD